MSTIQGRSQLIRPMGADSTTAPGINHGRGSQVASQDGRVENQQLPAPNASTVTPGHDGGDSASECGQP